MWDALRLQRVVGEVGEEGEKGGARKNKGESASRAGKTSPSALSLGGMTSAHISP